MRSHSFAALATFLTATSALVACGESVDVGNFEDGTGGAGGGAGPVTATTGPSAGPGTGPSTGTGTGTGTGGDDSTTAVSSTGTGGGGGTVCGGLGGDGENVCQDDEFCDWPDGGCGFDDGTGTCRPRPQACPFDVVAPVCTCDGEVYQSECFANLAGVDINAGASSCDPEVRNCGGKTGQVCNDDEFCEFEGGLCGENDASGVCTPRPTTCQTDGPVACACDGENYPSACEAAMHGADVWEGEDFCPEATPCGGIAGLQCEADEFCDYPNLLCGGDDGLGVCRPRPTECPEPNADEVVCGCVFGDTFGSECLANQAGQDITGGDGLECGGA